MIQFYVYQVIKIVITKHDNELFDQQYVFCGKNNEKVIKRHMSSNKGLIKCIIVIHIR